MAVQSQAVLRGPRSAPREGAHVLASSHLLTPPAAAVAASSSNKNGRQRVPGLAATAFPLRLNLKKGDIGRGMRGGHAADPYPCHRDHPLASHRAGD